MKVLYVGYSISLSKADSRNDLMLLQPSPFTHGNNSWSYFYLHIKTMTMSNYMMKYNLFSKMKMNPLLTLIQGLYKIIIDFMTMIGHQSFNFY